jgi:hypothetical protein
MTALAETNIESFRAFLKSRRHQKMPVTAVTAVTAIKPTACELQTLVTLVTEASGEIISDEILERQALAEIDGHVSPVFSMAFAAFQTSPPDGRTVEQWHVAIDDAGRFLDSHGQNAAALGWRSHDIFGPDGLAWISKGVVVTVIAASTAALCDGRAFTRFMQEARS